MYIVNAEKISITINIGKKGENPVLILKQPTNEAIRKFLNSRWKRSGASVDNRTIDARVRFINEHLIGVQNVGEIVDGKVQPLNTEGENWKLKIPDNWKSAAATQFEEQESLTEEDEKNS